jgi:predicted DNA-binding protein (MmcQ/YjbR family)
VASATDDRLLGAVASAKQTHARLVAFALSLPGAWEDHPWSEVVAKVGKKVFVFFGTGDGTRPLGMTVKLGESHQAALGIPGVAPTGYGLGKAGWVTMSFGGEGVPGAGVLTDWVEESYRLVASKKLIAELDARATRQWASDRRG